MEGSADERAELCSSAPCAPRGRPPAEVFICKEKRRCRSGAQSERVLPARTIRVLGVHRFQGRLAELPPARLGSDSLVGSAGNRGLIECFHN